MKQLAGPLSLQGEGRGVRAVRRAAVIEKVQFRNFKAYHSLELEPFTVPVGATCRKDDV